MVQEWGEHGDPIVPALFGMIPFLHDAQMSTLVMVEKKYSLYSWPWKCNVEFFQAYGLDNLLVPTQALQSSKVAVAPYRSCERVDWILLQLEHYSDIKRERKQYSRFTMLFDVFSVMGKGTQVP